MACAHRNRLSQIFALYRRNYRAVIDAGILRICVLFALWSSRLASNVNGLLFPTQVFSHHRKTIVISNFWSSLASGILCCLLLNACSSDSTGISDDVGSSTETPVTDSSESSTETPATDITDSTTDTTVVAGSLDPSLFVSGALVSDPVIVECTLSDGTETTCYEITTVGEPADAAIGPFCPETITTGSDESGIWLDGSGTVYNADGNFILDLPNIYGDANWQLYDVATGKVNITDTQDACEAAANPNVDEAYQNYCVECSLDYLGGGVNKTFLIPVTPILADAPGSLSTDVGLTLNGVELAAPAPVDAILSAYTIAAFDDCGGHVNPNAGYHYHAATGCTEAGLQDDGHAALMGYALDGYGIYGMLDSEGSETTGLDDCRGITDDVRGYHYHAASAGENMFIGCFSGKTVESTTDGVPGGGPPGGGPAR